MNTINRTPVVIINGFLGSGKTTLFRSLLAQSDKQNLSLCAVVNDMSELDIDGELISNTNMVENNNSMFESIHSCVLSSKQGIKKLNKSIERLLSSQQPDLIIIETSGSCHPLPLIDYFKSQPHLKLTGLLVLVDSLMLNHDYDNGKKLIPLMQENVKNKKRDTVNLLIEQIMFCSHLIITKADRITEEKLAEIAQAVHPINPYVSVLSVLFGKLSIDEILDMPEYDFHRVAQLMSELAPELALELSADRPYDMATSVIEDDRPFHPQRLWEVCHEHMGQGIYRSKGFFWLATRDQLALLWNQAGGSISLELTGYWRAGILQQDDHNLNDDEIRLLQERLANESGRFGDRKCQLTVIGDKAQVEPFTEALNDCFLTDEEIKQWKAGVEFADPWPKNIVKMAN